MATPNTERLAQIVKLLARISMLIDGGYQYSSPLVRENYGDKYAGPLVHHNGVLELLNAVATDVGHLGAELQAANELATSLGVDTIAIFSADLPALARACDALCIDIVAACVRASDTISPAKAPERTRRARTKALASSPPPDGQSGLFSNGDSEGSTGDEQP